MEIRYLVEDCFAITPRDVGWRLDRVRKLGVNILERRSDISYWFDDMAKPTCLFVSVAGHEPQKLSWETVEITFGYKDFFFCPCGHRAMKLYLLPGGNEFKCRKCHKLQYQIATFNPDSVAGKPLYKLNRLQRLADSRANMGRILYNGNYTKKFMRFLRLCRRAGLGSVVEDANGLMALIKG